MSAPKLHRPEDVQSLCEVIQTAAAHQQCLSIRGGGSKQGFGAPVGQAAVLDMSAFSGVLDYDPPELVITVQAGTLLSEVQRLVQAQGQMLAFDPFDHGPIFGTSAGQATIGGVVAANAAGARRLAHGSVRDHFLGFEAVSGRGEHFVAGGRVVKNVTGYDLSKLMAGSWGRLLALTHVSLKVLPEPRSCSTLQVLGLSPIRAQRLFSAMLGGGACLAAAAYVPGAGQALSMAMLRLEGFPPSVQASVAKLQAYLGQAESAEPLAEDAAQQFWTDLAALVWLKGDAPLWRISSTPSAAPGLAGFLETHGARWLWDWAGGLTWAATDADATELRNVAVACGGHAMLVRAPVDWRRRVPAFHPQAGTLELLEERVRRSFDPAGVFETGRFGKLAR